MKWITCLTALALCGCSLSEVSDSSCSPGVPEASDGPVTMGKTSDDGFTPHPESRALLRDIAEAVPGFGGYYFDGEGQEGHLNIYLVEPSQEAAEAARQQLLSKLDPTSRAFREAPVRAVQGQYDFAQLYAWYLPLLDRLVTVPEWSRGGIQEQHNRIYVGITDLAAKGKIELLLTEIGIPAEAVAIEEKPKLELLNGC